MASKQVTDREKATRAVVAAAETHAAEIDAGVSRELSPLLEPDEEMPNVGLLTKLIGRWLSAANTRLVEADAAHEAELSDDELPRRERDEGAAVVRGVLVDLRAAVEAAYGPSALTKLGLSQAVPVDPSVLATTAGAVHKNLGDAELALPKPKRAGTKIDREAFADELAAEDALPKLKQALLDVAREDREKEQTQRAKYEAMERNDVAFSGGAGWLSASCSLGGLQALAAKVRPSGRKPGQRQADDEDVVAGEEPLKGP